MRHLLQAAQSVTAPGDLQKPLGHLLAGVRSINAEAERAELRTVARLATALEGLLKKMCGHARLCTPSTFAAAAAALDLLEELCNPADASPNLTNPPVNILVVDDDPVARRAISMAVQLLFGRPDNAESGEAAVALAAQKSFDLILLDVLMPGMDGFATCRRIHQTESNHRTPVVFITSHDDAEARSKAVVSGGCGFVPKPVLASQVTLIALTYIIRARLNPARKNTEMSECLQPA
jgi:CheY-like chemotaxis protein